MKIDSAYPCSSVSIRGEKPSSLQFSCERAPGLLHLRTEPALRRYADIARRHLLLRLRPCRQAALREQIDGAIDGNSHYPVSLIHPAVPFQDLIFGGAHVLQVRDRGR